MSNVKIYIEEFGFTSDLGIDLSKYKHTGPATKALHKALCKYAEDIGQSADEVMLVRPEDNDKAGHHLIPGWGICWEGGPYEWAMELQNCEGDWGYGEPAYSFSISMESEV